MSTESGSGYRRDFGGRGKIAMKGKRDSSTTTRERDSMGTRYRKLGVLKLRRDSRGDRNIQPSEKQSIRVSILSM